MTYYQVHTRGLGEMGSLRLVTQERLYFDVVSYNKTYHFQVSSTGYPIWMGVGKFRRFKVTQLGP